MSHDVCPFTDAFETSGYYPPAVLMMAEERKNLCETRSVAGTDFGLDANP